MLDEFAQRFLPPLVASTVRDWRSRLVPQGSVRERFAGAVLWSVAGMAISNIAGLLTGVALARLMGREGYGEIGVIIGASALFSQLGGLGLAVTATRSAAQGRVSDPAGVGKVLGGLLVLSGVSYALAAAALIGLSPELASLLNRPSLAGAIRLSGLVMLLQGIDSVQSGILSGFEAFRAVARVTMLRVVVNFPVTVAGAWAFGLYGAIAAMAVTGVFTLLANRVALRTVLREHGVRLSYGLDWGILRPLWAFSLPAFLSATLTMVSMFVLNAMLVNQPDGYSQMGLFNAASQWRALGIFVPTVFNSAVLSIQSNLFAAGNSGAYHRSVTGNLLVQGTAATVVVGVLAALAPYLMRLYGAEYRDAGEVLLLLALGWLLLTPSWILWIAAVARGDVWQGLMLNAAGVIALVVLARAFVADGARGIAVAMLYAGLLHVSLQAVHYYLTRRGDVRRGAAS